MSNTCEGCRYYEHSRRVLSQTSKGEDIVDEGEICHSEPLPTRMMDKCRCRHYESEVAE